MSEIVVSLPGNSIDNAIDGYHNTIVINTVSEPVSVCPVECNISVPADFGITFQGVSGFLKNNLYIFL